MILRLFSVVVLWHMVTCVQGIDRKYYLAAEEVEWDYAPGGENIVDDRQEDADVFLKGDNDRIGRVYTKCVYRRYTDATFTDEVPKPGWMGIMGPALRAETGDRMIINFRNRCFRDFSVHPHGVMYTKENEGALYVDGTSGSNKKDDAVPPGGKYTYIWEIPTSFAPTTDDPPCTSWVYHSHVDAARDTNTGLIGLLLICKRGTLHNDHTRKDGQKDFAMLFKVFNEELSWYQEKNFNKCGNPKSCKELADSGDEDFAESNLLHGINGVLYGNLPTFTACRDELVTWHLVGMGTEVDLHTVLIHGQTLLYNKHRTESVGLFAAEFKSVVMIPQEPGRWLINCQVNDHYAAGMQAYLDVQPCGDSGPRVSSSYRVYYVAAEEVNWDYAPSGDDLFNGGSLTNPNSESVTYYEKGKDRIGGVYKKALFFEYADGTFTSKKERLASERHLGFLGPVIRGEVGETIIVVFRNMAGRSYSMQAHGVSVNKDEEGAKYNDNTQGVAALDNEVAPGGIFVYFWHIPEKSSPTANDPNCVTYFYQSSVDPIRDTSSGLVGPLLVCKKGSLHEDITQKDIDAEFILMFTITDENLSWYIDENLKTFTTSPSSVDPDDESFVESNKMRNINGRAYGNLEGLDVKLNSRVSWHLFGLGTEADLHTVYFHGNTLVRYDSRVDTIAVFPGTTSTATMIPDTPGVWGLVSRTNANFIGGMTALYKVLSNTPVSDQIAYSPYNQPTGATRTFYIAAIETDWDYAPLQRGIIEGKSLYDNDSPGNIFVRNDTGFIGSVYKKAVYREFTDGSFTAEKPRGPDDLHLGIMGPLIRAEVGDKINVVFKNLASRPYSLHPHGVLTDKGNEGALYQSAGSQTADDCILTGDSFTYTWNVTERAGPAAGDPGCIAWPYYSHVNPVKDVNSGLVGSIVVCRKGILNSNKRKDGIDKEFVLLFTVTDENDSWYLEENIRRYAPERTQTDDPDFEESNLMHGINGRIYGNNEGLVMYNGDTVAWHVLGLGTDIDIHTVHFHGQTLLHKQQVTNRVDVMEVFPGISESLEMLADNPGTWLLHCHITDHLKAGMETVYTILEHPRITTDAPNTTMSNRIDETHTICRNSAAWKFLKRQSRSRARRLWQALCNKDGRNPVFNSCVFSGSC